MINTLVLNGSETHAGSSLLILCSLQLGRKQERDIVLIWQKAILIVFLTIGNNNSYLYIGY